MMRVCRKVSLIVAFLWSGIQRLRLRKQLVDSGLSEEFVDWITAASRVIQWSNAFPKRYQNSITVKGRRISYPNRQVFAGMFEEIFEGKLYKREIESSEPIILDCGSNIGLSILYFKNLYPNSKITAFEPDPVSFEYLKKNVENWGFSGIRLLNAALVGDNATKVSLFQEATLDGFVANSLNSKRLAHKTEIKVDAVKLSDYIEGPVDLVKMDIEGAEEAVLAELGSTGKLQLIRQLVLEYHHNIGDRYSSFSPLLGVLEAGGFGYQVVGGHIPSGDLSSFQDVLLFAWNQNQHKLGPELVNVLEQKKGA